MKIEEVRAVLFGIFNADATEKREIYFERVIKVIAAAKEMTEHLPEYVTTNLKNAVKELEKDE